MHNGGRRVVINTADDLHKIGITSPAWENLGLGHLARLQDGAGAQHIPRHTGKVATQSDSFIQHVTATQIVTLSQHDTATQSDTFSQHDTATQSDSFNQGITDTQSDTFI